MKHALYLMFNGNCEEAINYYRDKLSANIISMQRYGESPHPSTEENKNWIIHSVLDLQGFTMMCSDGDGSRNVQVGDNFSIALDFQTDGALKDAFNALSTGGVITMPVQETFWGATFGMCKDKFGINWMFNYDKKPSAS